MNTTQKIEKMSDRDLLRFNKYLRKFKCNHVGCDECLVTIEGVVMHC